MQALILSIVTNLLSNPQVRENLFKAIPLDKIIGLFLGGLGGGVAPSGQATVWEGPFNMRWLQDALNKVLGENLPARQEMDERLMAQVKRFQTGRKDVEGKPLVPDGWPGFKTMMALYNELQKV